MEVNLLFVALILVHWERAGGRSSSLYAHKKQAGGLVQYNCCVDVTLSSHTSCHLNVRHGDKAVIPETHQEE